MWTVEEFFADSRPPTDDDVPIAADGRVLDTPAKVIAYIDEINDIGGVDHVAVDLAWRDELSRRSEQIADWDRRDRWLGPGARTGCRQPPDTVSAVKL